MSGFPAGSALQAGTSVMEALFAEHDYATDKLRAHSYIPVYEELFRDRKDRVSKVLEIGIGGGGSLRLWNDYFERADVYGIDLNYIADDLHRFERIHQIKDDAYRPGCIAEHFTAKGVRFDIIIDDGPHNKQSQMSTMQRYFPLLTDDGVIIIEDVQDYLDPGVWIRDIISALPTDFRPFAEVIDLRHFGKSPDDLLIVLDKSKVRSGAPVSRHG